MQNISQILASIAALLGPLATIIGLVQSRGWLTILGAAFVAVAVAVAVYARSQRRRLNAASIEIEGISIDSVNIANLRRGVNRSLTVQTADHIVTIDGGDLDMVWRYAGYCRARGETAMEFSVDSENSIAFSKLDCFAYDLERDPEKKHKIEPLLVGADGISKKIAVPFLEPLTAHEAFDIMLHCRMPGTYRPGVCYYTSTLSFDQNKIGRCTVHLTFLKQKPDWVRVYDCAPSAPPRLLKTLRPTGGDQSSVTYRDVANNIDAQSVRIYLFRRKEL
jgi:hypothetical protein